MHTLVINSLSVSMKWFEPVAGIDLAYFTISCYILGYKMKAFLNCWKTDKQRTSFFSSSRWYSANKHHKPEGIILSNFLNNLEGNTKLLKAVGGRDASPPLADALCDSCNSTIWASETSLELWAQSPPHLKDQAP